MGTVLQMVTSEAAVGIIRGPLCLSISMDESLCVPALLAVMILQVSDPSPRSAAAADVRAMQTSSCSLSSPPFYLPLWLRSSYPHSPQSGNKRVGVVFESVCQTSAGDWDRVKKKRKSPRSCRLLGVCV